MRWSGIEGYYNIVYARTQVPLCCNGIGVILYYLVCGRVVEFVKIYRLRGKGQWPATRAGGLARHRIIIFGHDRRAHSTLTYYTVADNIFRPFDDLLQNRIPSYYYCCYYYYYHGALCASG